MHLAHKAMGVCPQFDILWMDLTCLETVLFYARLKGIPPSHEFMHAYSYLELVSCNFLF